MKDLMECCDLCTLITHDQYGGESAECTDDNCTCHKIGTVKDFSPTPDPMEPTFSITTGSKSLQESAKRLGLTSPTPTREEPFINISKNTHKHELEMFTPTDSWVEIDEITETVNNTKYVEAKLAKEILSQVRQKAKEEVLRDIIVMETPTRGIEGETVMEYASSLGIDLSSNK